MTQTATATAASSTPRYAAAPASYLLTYLLASHLLRTYSRVLSLAHALARFSLTLSLTFTHSSLTPHSLLTAYQDAGGKAAHKGPKKTAFGVPEGFYPDKESGMYFNEASGYY